MYMYCISARPGFSFSVDNFYSLTVLTASDFWVWLPVGSQSEVTLYLVLIVFHVWVGLTVCRRLPLSVGERYTR
jgi:hypothetical protein